MKFLSLVVIGCLTFAALPVCATAAPPAAATADDAQGAAAKWLDGLGEKGLVLAVEDREAGFAGRHIAGSKSTMFVLTRPGWYVTLGFSDVVPADAPLQTVRKRFKYIALDRLPTPGLEVPGWNIIPRTPVSSFKEGVEILEYGEGRIKLRVQTKFFALYGRNPSVLVPADAPAPKGSYFQIRQRFPLDLTLDVPFAMNQ